MSLSEQITARQWADVLTRGGRVQLDDGEVRHTGLLILRLLDEIDRLTAQRENLREALERIAEMEPALEWDQWKLIESAQAYARTALKGTEA